MREQTRKELEALLRLARDKGLSELRLDRAEFKLLLRRGREPEAAEGAPEKAAPVSRGGREAASPPAGARAAESRQGRARPARPSIWEICSPLPGIFYRSASPQDKSFIEIGDLVEEGQTVCLVEAMKIFNEITSERRGRVVEILAENGELVEDGQVLIVLEPE
jgi:acetyl-CoA carboxylase biotin carboxyl carrier protein